MAGSGGGGGDGLEDDDPLAVGSYSHLLFSDEVDDHLSADDCFNFTSSFSSENPPKMLCFGGEYVEELCDLGFEDDDGDNNNNTNNKKKSSSSNTTRNIAPKAVVAATVTCSDSSSTSSTNNGDVMAKSLPKSNKKRNMSGLGGSDEQVQKNQNSDAGNNNANEIKSPVMRSSQQRNFKKTKSGNSSSEKMTNCHAKVKKEKLGERILALQQLVSPFGKSDTASVLHEAMGYIRFLHDQVQVLCSPYLQMRLHSSAHLPQQEGGENREGQGIGSRKDLRSKGLCLVPFELTVHVADNNGADFWSPAMVNGVSSNHS